MIRFSLLHPSRNRAALADSAIREWTQHFSGRHALEYILSIDSNERDLKGYAQVAERHGVRLLVNPNRSLVQAVNRAAEIAKGDILIVVSDDFGCPAAWDEELAAVLGERRDVAVCVHDGISGRILTLPILGRELYERLGYVYYPEYFSMYCDDDLTQTTQRMGKLIDARHLIFPHRHYSVGGTPFDETYARQNSSAAYASGWWTLEKRKAADFGLRPRTASVRARELWVAARHGAHLVRKRIEQIRERIWALTL